MPAHVSTALQRAMACGRVASLVAMLAGVAAAADGPVLRVTVNGSQPYVFVPGSPPVQLSLAASQPVHSAWEASPGDAGEPVDAFRFGWDISDPDNDEEWDQSWCSTCPPPPVRQFSSGTHRFSLQARDRAGVTTLAQIDLVIVQVPVAPTSWSRVKGLFGR